MHRLLITLAASLMTGLGMGTAAELPAPLERALSEAEAAGPVRVSFTMRFQWPDTEDVVLRFDAKTQSWTTLAGDPAHLPRAGRSKLAQVKREECPPGGLLYGDFRARLKDVTIDGETDDIYRFRFRPKNMSEDAVAAGTEQKGTAQLKVSKKDGTLILYAVELTAPARLGPLIRLEEFTYEQSFARPAEGAPALLTRIYNRARGTQNFRRIDQNYTVLFTDHVIHGPAQ